MFAWILDLDLWASLLTLTALEIVLGIDNVIFISVVAARLPAAQQPAVRRLGLGLALAGRLVLLTSLVWVIGLVEPVFTVLDHAVSWRDIILLAGGLFLLAKGTLEIHHTVEAEAAAPPAPSPKAYAVVVAQIALLDLVFSIDSVVTAVGMTERLPIMVAAVLIAIVVMLVAAGPVSDFIQRHPTSKMLALSFLLLVGVALIADGLHFHVPRGYLYFAIAFSVGVEALNILAARRRVAARR